MQHFQGKEELTASRSPEKRKTNLKESIKNLFDITQMETKSITSPSHLQQAILPKLPPSSSTNSLSVQI